MTPLWTSAELAAATGAPPPGFCASGVSIDSRTLAPGDLFVALVGDNGDGHDHVAEARAKGAAGVMAHRDVNGGPTLWVRDSFAGLQALGRFARARYTGRVVAVTGSVGKTTTKEMLRRMLGVFARTHAAAASYNNHWGVPLTLARMPASARFAVAEIGMNHAGEIAPLSRLVAPHVAVITAIERTHIGHLGSIEAIADEKAAVMAGLLPRGTVVLPGDSPLLPRLLRHASEARVLRFGTRADADARLLDRIGDADGSDVVALVGGTELRFRLGAPGRHMAMNAMAALACVHALGLDLRRAAVALADFTPGNGRGARRRIPIGGGEILLLDESYNASAASVRAALEVLALQRAMRRVAVLGDMLELGDNAEREHSGLASSVVSAADMVFTCGKLMRSLHDSLPDRIRGVHAGNSAALAPIVAAALRPGDAVLVKGSLGSRMIRIVQALSAPQSVAGQVR